MKTQPWPIGRWSDAIDLIASSSGLSEEEIVRRLRMECENLGANVCEQMTSEGIEPFIWTDRLSEWYRQTDAFLFESLVWNHLPTKIAMRTWIIDHLRRKRRQPGRVFCCGDGLGLDTAALVQAGHQVTYYEPSHLCRQFAEQVFRRNSTTVNQVESPDELQAGTFDAVICLDVLEHVPDPPSLIAHLTSLLRPQGLLIVHAPFWYLTDSTSTHLRSHRIYSGRLRALCATTDLVLRDGRLLWNPLVLERSGHAGHGFASLMTFARLGLGGILMRIESYVGCVLSPFTRMWLRLQSRRLRREIPKGYRTISCDPNRTCSR